MSSTEATKLRLDWCDASASRHACLNWHYAKSMPKLPMLSIGVWEGVFIGAVIFAAGNNRNIGKPFNCSQYECAELVRVALRGHTAPVTRIVAIAIKILKAKCPGLRLIVSYADPSEGHHGGIYQGGNWSYLGEYGAPYELQDRHARRLQKRAYTGLNFGNPALPLPPGARRVEIPLKHKYAMALDPTLRPLLDSLRKPYPKRVESRDGAAPGPQPGEGGSIPTSTL